MSIDLRGFEDVLNKTLLNATIPHITSAQIAWPDVTFTPTKGVPFLKVEMSARVRRPLGLGADGVQEWTGSYQIGVYVQRDSGTRTSNEIASALLAAFPRGLALQTAQGIWVYVTEGSVPVPVPYGEWVMLPVQIDWFAHEP